MSNGTPTTKEVYDLVDARNVIVETHIEGVRIELGNKIDVVAKSVTALATSFNTFEAGRVGALERRVALIETRTQEEDGNKTRWQGWIIPAILYVVGQIILIIIIKKTGP